MPTTLSPGHYLQTYSDPTAYIQDATGKIVGFEDPYGKIHYSVEAETNLTGGIVNIVVSSTAPVNGDGRPDGTIYIQTV